MAVSSASRSWIVLLHLAEIGVGAAFYVLRGAMADLPTVLHFSAVTYTTTLWNVFL